MQFAYAIGHPDPVSVHIDTFGTGDVADAKIMKAVNRVFSFQPADIIDQLNLLPPDLLEDDQLRSLRQERQGPDVGAAQQGAGPAEGDHQQPRGLRVRTT